jgi:glucans biosynthesis protein C
MTGSEQSNLHRRQDQEQRLLFLDWLRIAAFMLLVVFHVGMYYVTWGFHVKSPQASSALEPWMMLTQPWRMSLLFLISGAATAFLLEKSGSTFKAFKRRSRRILLPLLCGVVLVIPPQTYFEVIQKFKFAGGVAEFLKLYYSGYKGFCTTTGCLKMPTWNHLWFLPYLWIYTCLLCLWIRFRPKSMSLRINNVIAKLDWPAIVTIPFCILLVIRLGLFNKFPVTYDVVHDWFSHAQYVFAFALGALLTRSGSAWQSISNIRLASLSIALIAWLTYLLTWSKVPGWLTHSLSVTQQWFAILAALGYGFRYLNFNHPIRARLTEAVFPVYIFHQTWIIVLSQAIAPANLPIYIEAVAILVATFILSFASYLIVRNIRPLNLWFGIGSSSKSSQIQQKTVGT